MFFRYFKVDLDSSCPFWYEEGQCMMEGCSVCTCHENEIPKPWLEDATDSNITYEYEDYISSGDSEFGWITSTLSNYGYEGKGHDDSLGRITKSEENTALSPTESKETVYNPGTLLLYFQLINVYLYSFHLF